MHTNPVWYIFVHESQYGPVTLDTLRQWITDGRVQPGDLVWDFAGERWQAAKDFPELRDATPATPGDAVGKTSMPSAGELAGTRVYFASYRESSSERRYIRLTTCLPVTYQEVNPFNNELVSRPASTTIENISPGGLAFEVYDRKMPEKTILRLDIQLPHRPAPVTIKGEVTRVVAYPQSRYLLGIGFRETDQKDQDTLFTYLRTLLAEKPLPPAA